MSTNNTLISDALRVNLTAAQIHEIAAHVASPARIAALAAAITVTDSNGNPIDSTPAAEQMIAAQAVHTYNGWKQEGLQVRAGEKALFSCYLWRWTDKPSKARQQQAAQAAASGDDSPAADAHYYMTRCYMFSALQVGKPEPVHVKTPEEIAAQNAALASARKARRAAQQAAATTAPTAPTVPERASAPAPRKPATVAVVEHHDLTGDEIAAPVQLDFASIAAGVLA